MQVFNTHPDLTTRPSVSPHAVLGHRFEICACALVQVFELPMTEEHHNDFYSAEVRHNGYHSHWPWERGL